MARIRTVKPEFFRHEALYQAEKETGLPLRVAFAGLWTAADREGRFRWRPGALKLDCLPYDPVDFSEVLEALLTRGFLVRYENAGQDLGCIPSWNRHQVINNRESVSMLPSHEDPASSTRGPRDTHASSNSDSLHVLIKGEGKGREGEGNRKGRERTTASAAPSAGGDGEGVPLGESATATRELSGKVPDDAFDWWATSFLGARSVPYQHKVADFVRLAALRKACRVNGKGMPPQWQTAVRNYLASPLPSFTLADLCSRFDVFVQGEVDRFGRPAGFSDVHQANKVSLHRLGEKGFFDDSTG